MCEVCKRYNAGTIDARQAKVLLWTAIELAKNKEEKLHIQEFYTKIIEVLSKEDPRCSKRPQKTYYV